MTIETTTNIDYARRYGSLAYDVLQEFIQSCATHTHEIDRDYVMAVVRFLRLNYGPEIWGPLAATGAEHGTGGGRVSIYSVLNGNQAEVSKYSSGADVLLQLAAAAIVALAMEIASVYNAQ